MKFNKHAHEARVRATARANERRARGKDKEMSSMYAGDAKRLHRVADYIKAGKLKRARSTIDDLDTAVRDQVSRTHNALYRDERAKPRLKEESTMKRLGELLAIDEKRHTDAYKFTVKKGDAAGEGKLRDFKRLSKLHNIARKAFGSDVDKTAVTVRDRLGKNNPNSKLQRKRGSYAGPQMIKRGHGERSDVYLHNKKVWESEGRSGTHKFTYKHGDEKGVAKERDLRRLTKLHNIANKAFDGDKRDLRVTRMNRLGKNSPHADKYSYTNSEGKKRRMHPSGGLKPKYDDSERHDVYLHTRYKR